MNSIIRLKVLGYLQTVPLAKLTEASAFAGEDQDHPILSGLICGSPDFADAEIAAATPVALSEAIGENEEFCQCIVSVHKKMLAATGKGSWPSACNTQYPKNHSCTYYVDRATFNSSHYHRVVTDSEIASAATYFRITDSQAGDRYGKLNLIDLALKMMEESFRRTGCAMIEVPDHDTANIHISTRSLGGSTIGMAEFNNGTCGDHVNHWIDTNYRPGLNSLAHLFTHESGHNHNLEHQFSNQSTHHSVMSYSPKQPFVGFSKGESDRPDDVSLPILARQYGADPVPSPDDPLPPPPPPPTGDYNGVFTYNGKLLKIKVFE